jgi:hypothetical protein
MFTTPAQRKANRTYYRNREATKKAMKAKKASLGLAPVLATTQDHRSETKRGKKACLDLVSACDPDADPEPELNEVVWDAWCAWYDQDEDQEETQPPDPFIWEEDQVV